MSSRSVGANQIHVRCRFPLLSCLLIAALAIGGCSRAKPLRSVTGSVEVKGEPAVGAVVLFHPVNAPKAITASGVVADDGSFTLISGLDKGIADGDYQVTVVWPDPAKKGSQPKMLTGGDNEIPDLLKGRYASRDESKLTATIAANTKQLDPIQLDAP